MKIFFKRLWFIVDDTRWVIWHEWIKKDVEF